MTNAIILAAGLGSRFGNVTKTIHKALLPIDNIPNVERTIQFLHEFGIEEVHIVIGYLADQFKYLEKKYNCHLIFNENYARYNNLFSFYKAIEHFDDTYVIDADVVFFTNFLRQHQYSTYYVIERSTDDPEWIPILDNEGFVKEIIVSTCRLPSLLGVSYWNKSDCSIIKDKIEGLIGVTDYFLDPKKYWDDIPRGLLPNIKVLTENLNRLDAGEMDNVKDYLTMQKWITLDFAENLK